MGEESPDFLVLFAQFLALDNQNKYLHQALATPTSLPRLNLYILY
jgi:hypothetical protein